MKEKTADEMFGVTPVPGEAVPHKDVDPLKGYRPRPRFRRRLDGRVYPVDVKRETPETELPNEFCPQPDDHDANADDSVCLHRRRFP